MRGPGVFFFWELRGLRREGWFCVFCGVPEEEDQQAERSPNTASKSGTAGTLGLLPKPKTNLSKTHQANQKKKNRR